MFEVIDNAIQQVDDFIWNVPLIILILATGIYLTCRFRMLNIRNLGKALKFMVANEEGGNGDGYRGGRSGRAVLDDRSGVFRNGD